MVDHPGHTSPPQTPSQDGSGEGDRVAKLLARAGVASRREIERLIEAGRVALNGQVLTTPAVKVQPGDILTVDGNVVGSAEATRVWRYHKPAGLLTSHNDPQGRPTVFEHLPEGLPRVISIGRLDLNSEGLLLLTNDGELSRALELPATGWVRRYRARAFGHTTQAKLDKLKDGITVEGVAYGSIEAKLDKAQGPEKEKGPANLWITVSLTEGKNREVRRVLEAIGLKVNRLIRLSYGPFALGTLEVGQVEEVGPRVIREQLSDFIAAESLPKGDRRPDRPMDSTPAPHRRSASATSATGGEARPRPKAARPEVEKEKKEYKPGWAKPKRKAHGHASPSAPHTKGKGERQSWGEKSTFTRPKTQRSETFGRSDGSGRPERSGGKARVSTNPDGSRAERKAFKAGGAPPREDKPAWGKRGGNPFKPDGPRSRGDKPAWGERSGGERKAERPTADRSGGKPRFDKPKRPSGRVYGLPQHAEAHERNPWEADKPAKPGGDNRPPRRGPPKPRKPR